MVTSALLRHGATVATNTTARRPLACEPDFCALHCDDVFLVGYGLDFNGKYRNLPYIGYIE